MRNVLKRILNSSVFCAIFILWDMVDFLLKNGYQWTGNLEEIFANLIQTLSSEIGDSIQGKACGVQGCSPCGECGGDAPHEFFLF